MTTTLDLLAGLDASAPPELREALRRLITLTDDHAALSGRVAALEAQSEAVTAWVARARQAIENLPPMLRRMLPELPEL